MQFSTALLKLGVSATTRNAWSLKLSIMAGWRGAVNAMEQLVTNNRVLLSQSFRFGTAIADAATTVLRRLGATHPLVGLPGIESHISRVRPDVILTRSNAGVIGSVLQCLARGVSCHVLGGTRELKRLLEDVKRIKQGAPPSPQSFSVLMSGKM